MANNWDITQVTTAQNDKEGAINNLVAKVIEGVGASLTVDFPSDANYTPTAATVLAGYKLNVTSAFGSLTATRNLVLPLKKKTWVIKNGTTGGHMIQVIGSSGTGVTIPNGATLEVICDGTNFTQLRPGDSLLAYKTADQLLIGIAFADVTELGFPVAANTAYAFEFHLIADADATTTGIDVACNGPAAPTSITYTQEYWTTTAAKAVAGALAYDNNTGSLNSAGASDRIYTVRGILRNGANAGILIPRIKRENVGTGPNVYAGSWGSLTKLT